MSHIVENIIRSIGHWRSEDDMGNELGSGTCWPISSDIVVTNYHVAIMGPKAIITFKELGRFPAIGIVAYDKPRDIALVKLRVGNKILYPLDICEELPKTGSEIYVYGNPLGLSNTVTKGIISATRKTQELKELGFKDGRPGDLLLQIDAAINPGNSGGPIINNMGHAIGMSSFKLKKGYSLNFGIPSSYVTELFDLQDTPKKLSDFYITKAKEHFNSKSAANNIYKRKEEESDEYNTNLTARELSEEIFQSYLDMSIAIAVADGEFHDKEAEFLAFCTDKLCQNTEFTLDHIKKMVEKSIIKAHNDNLGDIVSTSANFIKEYVEIDTRKKMLEVIKYLSVIDGEVSSEEEELLEVIQTTWDDI